MKKTVTATARSERRPAAGRYYLDTSAYLAILLGEAGHEAVAREIEGGVLVSSVLLALEAHRTVVRLGRDRVLGAPDVRRALDQLARDLDAFILRDLSLDLCREGPVPLVSIPRSLDLAHLRTALWFHGRQPLARFLTLDSSQRDSARELGLPT